MCKRAKLMTVMVFAIFACISLSNIGLAQKGLTGTIYSHLSNSENNKYYCLFSSWGYVIHCFPKNGSVAKDVLSVCKVGEYCKITFIADDCRTARPINIGNYGGKGGTLVHKVLKIEKITNKNG